MFKSQFDIDGEYVWTIVREISDMPSSTLFKLFHEEYAIDVFKNYTFIAVDKILKDFHMKGC